MKLIIKNMVCRHCVECVRRVLADGLGLTVEFVELGAAVIAEELSGESLAEVARALEAEGFQLTQSREAEIIDSIKRDLIAMVRGDGDCRRESLKVRFDGKFGLSYPSLSRLFSEIEGRSLESYYIGLRVERVKELIKYLNLTLQEIAYMTGYSSAAHMSRQFKQATGLTPGEFRDLGGARKPLPEV